jgi:hypothetical protein
MDFTLCFLWFAQLTPLLLPCPPPLAAPVPKGARARGNPFESGASTVDAGLELLAVPGGDHAGTSERHLAAASLSRRSSTTMRAACFQRQQLGGSSSTGKHSSPSRRVHTASRDGGSSSSSSDAGKPLDRHPQRTGGLLVTGGTCAGQLLGTPAAAVSDEKTDGGSCQNAICFDVVRLTSFHGEPRGLRLHRLRTAFSAS